MFAEDEPTDSRLIAVTLDEATIERGSADQEHERATAIFDLVECNCFAVEGHSGGPYILHLSMREARLVFDIQDAARSPVITHMLSLTPFRRILKDYFSVCESYYAAIRTSTPAQIESIDMGRRGLHDDGARLLTERLSGKVVTDFDTARRLFTLVTALHWKA